MANPVVAKRKRKSDFLTALPFMGPALIGLSVFVLIPGIRGIYLSFTEYNIFRAPKFIGIDNYTRMFADPVFWNALWVTLEYVVINIAIQTALALFIAVLMQRYTRSTVIRGIILLPYLFLKRHCCAGLVLANRLQPRSYQLGHRLFRYR